jgi:hypothetical protein
MINFLLKIIVLIFFIKVESKIGKVSCYKVYRFFSIYFISFYTGKIYYHKKSGYKYQNPRKININKLTKNLKDIEYIKLKYCEEELRLTKQLEE